MAIGKEQFESLCAAYALGIIEPEEQTLLDEALATGGEEFAAIFRESVGVSHTFNSGVKRAIPSSAVRSRILKQIQFGNRTPASLVLWFEKFAVVIGFGRPGFGLLVALLLIFVIVEIGAYTYVMYGELTATIAFTESAENMIGDQEQRLLTASAELEKKDAIIELLNSRQLMTTVMTGQDSLSTGYGKVMWDPDHSSAVINLNGLPPLPAGKAYLLWVLDKNNTPLREGTVVASDSINDAYRMTDLSLPEHWNDLGAFGITMGPSDSTSRPAGSFLFYGTASLPGGR